MNEPVFWIAPIAALLALAFALVFYRGMVAQDEGTPKMIEIGDHVRRGAMAYLRQQYKVMGIAFAGLAGVFAILAWGLNAQSDWLPFTFLAGGLFSALAGFFASGTFLSVLYYPHYWYLSGFIVAASSVAGRLQPDLAQEASRADVAPLRYV